MKNIIIKSEPVVLSIQYEITDQELKRLMTAFRGDGAKIIFKKIEYKINQVFPPVKVGEGLFDIKFGLIKL